MKNITKAIAIALVILGFSAASLAQNSTASAKILAGLTVTKVADLNFGTMTVPTAPTTVTLTPLGVLSNGGNITNLAQAPTALVASYTVSGDNNANYAITLPADGVVTITNAATNTMAVNGFISSKALNQSTTDGVGADAFTVGATLVLGTNQPGGSYTGSYNVTVAYN